MLWLLLLAWSTGSGPGGPGITPPGPAKLRGMSGAGTAWQSLFRNCFIPCLAQRRDEYRIHCFGHETVG